MTLHHSIPQPDNPNKVYSDVRSEYQAATEGAAIFDSSNTGRLKAVGADVLDLLNRMSTNQVLSLQPGQGAPTILTTDRGRILDLVAVVNTGEYVLLITSPGTQQTVLAWLDKFTIMEDVAVEDITGATTMLAVLGPNSQSALESASGIRLDSLPPFHSVTAQVAGQSTRLIRRHLAGLPSFDVISWRSAAADVWQHLVAHGLTPVGTESYEAVRVRCGVPLHGRELGEPYNPLEAGLVGSINFEKGCYIGQEVIARLDTYNKVQRNLVVLRFHPESSRQAGAIVSLSQGAALQYGDQEIGSVTSMTQIPTTGEIIGLGYVKKGAATLGTRLKVVGVPDVWAQIEALPLLFGPGRDYS